MSAPLIAARGLGRRFPARRGYPPVAAVDGVDLTLAPGEVLGLVGASGCGKTTLARMLVRLLPPTAGRVTVDGIDVWGARGEDLARVRRTVQIVFQDPARSLNPRMGVGAIVAEPLAVHGLPEGPRRGRRAARRRRAGELLDAVGLPARTVERRPAELSGGARQRVALARALALEPRALVLDEPISSLDASVGAQVMTLLRRLRQERGLAYLLVSHDLAVVGEVADRVMVMSEGRIVEEGTADRVYAQPEHERTRELLAAARSLSPPAPPQSLSAPPWGWPGSISQA